MISYAGMLGYFSNSGVCRNLSETGISQRFRTDSVEIAWR